MDVPHHRGMRLLLPTISSVGYFTSHKNQNIERAVRRGPWFFVRIRERLECLTIYRMMLQQRQYILLRYFKSLSVSTAGVWTCDLPLGRPANPDQRITT